MTGTSKTENGNGNGFVTWKRVALSSFAIIGALIVFGGNAMVNVSNSHLIKAEAPAVIAAATAPLLDRINVNGNRITTLETKDAVIQEQLRQINAKLDRMLERRP